MHICRHYGLTFCCLITMISPLAAAPRGYYRQPAIHKDTLIFVAEGDLWRVSTEGGQAVRLTSHAGDEALPAIAPDGQTVAFTATYEGPEELYTMPISSGQPTRWTYAGADIGFVGWTPQGKPFYATRKYSTLPNMQLVTLELDLDKRTSKPTVIPLAQAADGCYDAAGTTLYFTRLPFQGSHTRRYKGGTVQSLWRFGSGAKEAEPLTANYPGTSRHPMWWRGRIYFVSDRDGTMNLWSMQPDGTGLKQHTQHAGWDVASPSLHEGRIVYQRGADLHLFDLTTGQDKQLAITLSSDLDQQREHWIEKPMDYLTSAHIAADGDRVVLTARGQVFVAPVKQGRLVAATHDSGVRHRDARFLPDGKALVTLSDQSGEVELWQIPANGVGTPEQLTKGGEVLRWEAIPSPDGQWLAHHDKNQQLFLYNVKTKQNRKIDSSSIDNFADLRWSPDSRWLAYVKYGDNLFRRIKIYHVKDETNLYVTTDRYDSYSPAWSPDGQWLYFLSDRNLKSLVGSPWGTYQPEPFFDKKTKIYHIALQKGLRSPFAPVDELHPADTDKKKDKKEDKGEKQPPLVVIDLDGIAERLYEVPVEAGNYDQLASNDRGLFFTSTSTDGDTTSLLGVALAREDVKTEKIAADIKRYELSGDGKHLLIQKKDQFYVIDAAIKSAELDKHGVKLGNWKLSVIPREEWRQMFMEAWRLERDYFYDRNLHGIDWKAMRDKYLPLVERVRSRAELSDLVAQMVAELSALHIFVRGGDLREGSDDIAPAALGAVLVRDPARGGYRVEHIYQSDPDEPQLTAPLARPEAAVREGDVIEMIDGMATLSAADIGALLRNKAGQQVLLRVRPVQADKSRDVIVRPISLKAEENLRYHEWEYTRRLEVEKAGQGQVGYVHLRAMGGANFTEWARNYYPIYTRQGLIIDVRHNRGGNIDSWILGRLLRKVWFYWTQRTGQAPLWNMQYAFRGHIVVLCNEWTASDGEAFTEGVKRLELGKVIGTRTWGGEIWLSANNFLVDKGIATAAEFGVYGPKGMWLIEGHGVEPDIVVDNLPHATFQGEDAQLQAAIRYLNKQIKEKPVPVPPVPKFPNKRFPDKRNKGEKSSRLIAPKYGSPTAEHGRNPATCCAFTSCVASVPGSGVCPDTRQDICYRGTQHHAADHNGLHVRREYSPALHRCWRQCLAAAALEPVANVQVASVGPTLADDVEQMVRRGAKDLAVAVTAEQAQGDDEPDHEPGRQTQVVAAGMVGATQDGLNVGAVCALRSLWRILLWSAPPLSTNRYCLCGRHSSHNATSFF